MPPLPTLEKQAQTLCRMYPALKVDAAKTAILDGNEIMKHILDKAKIEAKLKDYPYERRGSAGWRYGVPCSHCGQVRWLRKSDAQKALRGNNRCKVCNRLTHFKQYQAQTPEKESE